MKWQIHVVGVTIGDWGVGSVVFGVVVDSGEVMDAVVSSINSGCCCDDNDDDGVVDLSSLVVMTLLLHGMQNGLMACIDCCFDLL